MAVRIGALVARSTVFDEGGLEFDGAFDVVSVTVGAATYLYASGFFDDGLSGFQVSAGGTLTNIVNVADSATLEIGRPEGRMAVASVGGVLSVFYVAAGGVLTEVTSAFDTPVLALGDNDYNDFTVVGGRPMLVASGSTDDGLSVFALGGGDDALVGTADADVLLGLAGADRLLGGVGADRLFGGLRR